MKKADQIEPVVEDVKNSGDQLQKELETRPEGQRVNAQTTDVTNDFVDSKRGLAGLVKRLDDYSGVAEKFTKSYEGLEEWLPIVKEQVLELKPISTQPDVIEEQIHETEVCWTCSIVDSMASGVILFRCVYMNVPLTKP